MCDHDLTYAISEIQDIQSELEEHNLTRMAQRLEGIEARLGEIRDALDVLTNDPPMGGYAAANHARTTLGLPPRTGGFSGPTYRG